MSLLLLRRVMQRSLEERVAALEADLAQVKLDLAELIRSMNK